MRKHCHLDGFRRSILTLALVALVASPGFSLSSSQALPPHATALAPSALTLGDAMGSESAYTVVTLVAQLTGPVDLASGASNPVSTAAPVATAVVTPAFIVASNHNPDSSSYVTHRDDQAVAEISTVPVVKETPAR